MLWFKHQFGYNNSFKYEILNIIDIIWLILSDSKIKDESKITLWTLAEACFLLKPSIILILFECAYCKYFLQLYSETSGFPCFGELVQDT